MKQFFLKFKTIKLLDFALIGIIVILGVSIATVVSKASFLKSNDFEVGGTGRVADTLTVGASGKAIIGLIVHSGSVGIGTTPAAKLDVAGQIKITGGSHGANKILTSDANGLATWATPPIIIESKNGSGWYTCSGSQCYAKCDGDSLANKYFSGAQKEFCKRAYSKTEYSGLVAGGGNTARMRVEFNNPAKGWQVKSNNNAMRDYICSFSEISGWFGMVCPGMLYVATTGQCDGYYYNDEVKIYCEDSNCSDGWKYCTVGSTYSYDKGSQTVSITPDLIGNWQARERKEIGLEF